ncbi:MAG: tetratricopeptide repeat protein [Verrucomicrobiales bacterium]|nr:tetratricopeptide repeat protein [Verrucomicrobiales bacterium]
MLALLTDLLRTGSPVLILVGIFAVWMLVDAIRRGEWLWAVFIFIFPFINPFIYYFLVYRQTASPLPAVELPGRNLRQRIHWLKDQIHHLDKAHHHLELGDIYFKQGKLEQAETSYRAAIERDPEDPDARAHIGQCLLKRGRPADALPQLQYVVDLDPTHEFGDTLMALAEAQMALGQTDQAIANWRRVLEKHTYARARVQLAELLAAKGENDAALALAREVVEDEAHAPQFQRRRERDWLRRGKVLASRLRG